MAFLFPLPPAASVVADEQTDDDGDQQVDLACREKICSKEG